LLYLPEAFLTNYREFLGSCQWVEFPFVIDGFQVEGNVVSGTLKELRHIALRHPQRFPFQANIESYLAVIALINKNFTFGRFPLMIHIIVFLSHPTVLSIMDSGIRTRPVSRSSWRPDLSEISLSNIVGAGAIPLAPATLASNLARTDFPRNFPSDFPRDLFGDLSAAFRFKRPVQ